MKTIAYFAFITLLSLTSFSQIPTRINDDLFIDKTAKYGIPILLEARLEYEDPPNSGNYQILPNEEVEFFIIKDGENQIFDDQSQTSTITDAEGIARVYYVPPSGYPLGGYSIIARYSGNPLNGYSPAQDLTKLLTFKKPKWLCLLYFDGDNDIEESMCKYLFKQIIKECGNNDDASIVVLFDRKEGNQSGYPVWTGGRIYRIVRDGDKPLYYYFFNEWIDPNNPANHEPNMGDPQTLKTFVTSIRDECPAEHFYLEIKDHGGGWKSGICVDDTDNEDVLTEEELRNAGLPVSNIAFYAACLMGNTEILAGTKGFADIAIASQTLTSRIDYKYNDVFNSINGSTSPADLTNNLVTLHAHKVRGAWKLDKMNDLQTKISELASELITHLQDLGLNQQLMELINDDTHRFEPEWNNSQVRDWCKENIDLGYFCKKIMDNNACPAIVRNKAEIVFNLLTDINFRIKWRNDDPIDIYGLSIFFPKNPNSLYNSEYFNNLSFTSDPSQYWDDFLLAYYKMANVWIGLIDNNWFNDGNWSVGKMPTNTDKIIILQSINDPVISAGNAYADETNILSGKLTISGGTLFIKTNLEINSEIDITGGVSKIIGDLYTKEGSLFTISGGQFEFANWRYDANNEWAKGNITLTGGTIKAHGSVEFHKDCMLLQNGPFIMYIDGHFRLVNTDANTTGGTVILTGIKENIAICHSSDLNEGNDMFVWNLVFGFSSKRAFSLSVADPTSIHNNITIKNDLKIANGILLSNINNWGRVKNITINGNVTVYPGSCFKTDFRTEYITIGGQLKLLANSTSSASWIDAGFGQAVYAKNTLVQTYISKNKWHTISSPVAESKSFLFKGKFLQEFDETNNNWSDIELNIPLPPMKGYALYSKWEYCIPWLGTLNTQAYGCDLSRKNQGWNMIGNPYPSAIDWDADPGWNKVNVANAIYIENNGNWATYINGAGANGGTSIIAPAQGFFVECTADPGHIAVSNDARTIVESQFFKQTKNNLLRVQASGNDRTDETVIYFNENSTRAFDYNYDAHKMFAYLDEIPQIYSLDNGDMAINALPEADMVLLGFKAGVSGQYTLAATEINDIPHAILEDLETGVMVDLRTSSYVFNYMVGEDEARFALHFVPKPMPTVLTDVVRIYSTGQDIYVNAPEGFSGEVFVYDLLGQKVSQTHISNMLNKITVSNSGTYVVRVINPEVAVSGKLVVSK